MGNELATQAQAPSIGGMLQSVIDSGVTADNVGALEKLVGLYERNEARMAEQAFAQAFVALQAEMPRVEAVKVVPDNNGNERYRFAPYEHIMKQVQPLLTKHGFTVAFDTRTDGTRIAAICTLMHASGHSRKNEFACQIGSGPPKATPTQADGAAKTYAKRGALSDALNIVTAVDTDGADDARVHGAPIDDMAADFLKKRVAEVGSDPEAFLRWLGVTSFHHIPDSRLEEAHAQLDRAEAKKRKV